MLGRAIAGGVGVAIGFFSSCALAFCMVDGGTAKSGRVGFVGRATDPATAVPLSVFVFALIYVRRAAPCAPNSVCGQVLDLFPKSQG